MGEANWRLTDCLLAIRHVLESGQVVQEHLCAETALHLFGELCHYPQTRMADCYSVCRRPDTKTFANNAAKDAVKLIAIQQQHASDLCRLNIVQEFIQLTREPILVRVLT